MADPSRRFPWCIAPLSAYLLAFPIASAGVENVSAHDLARLGQILLMVVCSALVLWRPPAASPSRPWSPAQNAFGLAVLAFAAISIAQSPVPEMAAREFAVFAGLVATALVVARLRKPMATLTIIATVSSAAYVLIVLLIIGMAYSAGQPLHRPSLFVGYDNYRFFNHTQTAAIPLAVLALATASRGGWLRRLAWLSAVGGFALLYAVAGRGTMVGIVLGAIAIGLMFGRASLAILRPLAIVAMLGLVFYALVFVWLPWALDIPPVRTDEYYGDRSGSIQMRLYLWGIALDYIVQSPWFGIGPMHYAHVPTGDAAHPHNFYLQIASEWGLPMLLLLAGLTLQAMRKLAAAVRNCRDDLDRDVGIGLVMTCLAIGIDGCFSGNFVMPVPQVWIAFTFGWAAAWLATQEQQHQDVGTGQVIVGSGRRVLAVGVLALQLWLAWDIWPEATQIGAHIEQVMTRFATAMTNPRFWSHGWF